MSTTPGLTHADSEHSAAWALLPWYGSETLSRDEAELVRAHLVACAACREEMERCRALAVVARGDDEDAWAPSPQHFAHVMARIEQAESAAATAPPRRARPGWFAAVRTWAFEMSRPTQWVMAAQGVLLLVAAGVLLTTLPARPSFETLSAPAAGVASGRARLHVMFSGDVTVNELHGLLGSIPAQIVGGPSPTGVYALELPFKAGDAQAIGAALARLRQHAKVELAEPVSPGSAR